MNGGAQQREPITPASTHPILQAVQIFAKQRIFRFKPGAMLEGSAGGLEIAEQVGHVCRMGGGG